MRLLLTSPASKGEAVTLAQKTLAGGNAFGIDFKPGKIDGEFGEQTGSACIRAKTFLGYPPSRIQPSYGQELDDYLSGKALPLFHKWQQKHLPKGLGARALSIARTHIGEREQPANSNKQQFGVWYGVNGQPWCAMFVSYCYAKAGSKTFAPRQHYAYVPFVVNDARAGRNGLSVTQHPVAGDLVCFDWDGGVADHIGLFDHWSGGNDFVSVEGNTAVGNDSNGGQVMERKRRRAQVEAFVRVGR